MLNVLLALVAGFVLLNNIAYISGLLIGVGLGFILDKLGLI